MPSKVSPTKAAAKKLILNSTVETMWLSFAETDRAVTPNKPSIKAEITPP